MILSSSAKRKGKVQAQGKRAMGSPSGRKLWTVQSILKLSVSDLCILTQNLKSFKGESNWLSWSHGPTTGPEALGQMILAHTLMKWKFTQRMSHKIKRNKCRQPKPSKNALYMATLHKTLLCCTGGKIILLLPF